MSKSVKACIITIGDEILYGETLDTNTHFISEQLSNYGIRVHKRYTISDDRIAILQTLEAAAAEADIILTTGGLGPTKDDITKHTFAEFLGVPLKEDKEVLEHVQSLFESRGRVMNALNRAQALVPEGAEVMKNDIGTAPGLLMQKNGKLFGAMPGVPKEMEFLIRNRFLPAFLARFNPNAILHKKIQTVGLPESVLAEKISEWEEALPEHIKLAYLPKFGRVMLRLTVEGESRSALQAELDLFAEQLMPKIQKYVYAFGDITLEEAMAQKLKSLGKTLATAESCTGGSIARLMTRYPGASAFFKGGVVAYANEVKADILGVKPQTLATYGAVSEETALEMAIGVRNNLKTDYAIATTGVAGPEGGSPEKPVGLVWIAVADDKGAKAHRLQLTQKRDLNITLSTNAALNLLRLRIDGHL
ncbi:MAG: competence/damage-inducible protein A [Bernardetiaceae bacterium]|nr:competence/damage-inducible protein A [Bernardetiaceae bacterium]